MFISPAIEVTQDGSQTLRHSILGEAYHSTRGAVGESRHIFLEAGLHWWLDEQAKQTTDKSAKCSVRIFEVGFGSGLNAYLTLKMAADLGVQVEYVSVELYPVDMEVAQQLQYAELTYFVELHRVPWNEAIAITDTFVLHKWEGKVEEFPFDVPFDLIYFDAFAPEIQPELWSKELFERLFGVLNRGGALVTYSAKGMVKEHLREAGFTVKRLTGALGKRHMVRATKA